MSEATECKWLLSGTTLYVIDPQAGPRDRLWWATFRSDDLTLQALMEAVRLAQAAPDLLAACVALRCSLAWDDNCLALVEATRLADAAIARTKGGGK